MDGREVERLLAVERYRRGERIGANCASLKRSRSWFYKWLSRAEHEETGWNEERSRRRHDPGACEEDLRTRIIEIRRRLEAAGTFVSAQMIAWELEDEQIEPPSISTIKRILKVAGLTVPKRRMPKGTRYPAPLAMEPGSVRFRRPALRWRQTVLLIEWGRCIQWPRRSRTDSLARDRTRHSRPVERLDENGPPIDPATRQRAGFLRESAVSACERTDDAAVLCCRCGDRVHSDPRAVAEWRGREVQRPLEPHVLSPRGEDFIRRVPERVAAVREPAQLDVAIQENRRANTE